MNKRKKTHTSSFHSQLHLNFTTQLVEVIVDLCSGGSLDSQLVPLARSTHDESMPRPPPPPIPPDAHTCRGAARLPAYAHVLNIPQPLQVGGMAHPPPTHTLYGWSKPIKPRPLKGCVRNLRVNGEVS